MAASSSPSTRKNSACCSRSISSSTLSGRVSVSSVKALGGSTSWRWATACEGRAGVSESAGSEVGAPAPGRSDGSAKGNPAAEACAGNVSASNAAAAACLQPACCSRCRARRRRPSQAATAARATATAISAHTMRLLVLGLPQARAHLVHRRAVGRRIGTHVLQVLLQRRHALLGSQGRRLSCAGRLRGAGQRRILRRHRQSGGLQQSLGFLEFQPRCGTHVAAHHWLCGADALRSPGRCADRHVLSLSLGR